MRRASLTARAVVLIIVVSALGGAQVAGSAPSGIPLQTAVFDPISFPDQAHNAASFARVAAAGATQVRLIVQLDGIAPGGETKPGSFDPTDPADPLYSWAGVDDQVQKAVAEGLEPILCLVGMPVWGRDSSQSGYARPSSVWFGQLAEGVARRYSGSFAGLPRVHYYQALNEPNLGPNLEPQRIDGSPISPDWYRRMVNAFADGVKAAHPDNLVIAGGLAPYDQQTGDGVAPLTFMKQFLCMTGMRIHPRPRCLERVAFDIWAMQPYTWGGPTHHETAEGDIALADLPTMAAVLDQAVADGRVISDQPVRFWVTEFSWDTNPPDAGGVDIDLQTRWTAHALYVMWKSGVSLVTWFLLRDLPPTERFQSGLYYSGSTFAADTPKPTLQAFRFPTVAFVEPGGIRVWTRTPGGVPGTVTFEIGPGSGPWTPLGTITSDTYGIATGLIASATTTGYVRARLPGGETSVPFSLTEVPDQAVNPFGN